MGSTQSTTSVRAAAAAGRTIAGQPDLEIERGPNWLFVRVRRCRPGDMDVLSLAERVTAALDQHFINRVVLEFEESVLPCEQLIEELRLLEEWIDDHHGVLRLCGLPARYTKSFLHSQVTQRFPVYQDREEAVWGGPRFCPPR
ncbi:MAG: hypothetical protein ACYC3X_06240 [Pirellulaceae bacterium]